jgi:beta-galactosidase
MRACGMDTVRIADFAWSTLEPSDGRFSLDLFAAAIDRAAAHGLSVVLCTPTAAPPAWLTASHPEVLLVQDNGRTQGHGMRCHYRPVSPVYRRYCARIAEVLATRFGRHAAVIGWQVDNEHAARSHDPETIAAFAAWCRTRYGSLDRLNAAWSQAYWSEAFSAWTDVHAPPSYPNPGLRLAWHRFSSALTADFQRIQIAAIRRHADPRQWITHNFFPHDDLDRSVIATDLDVASWDAYAVEGDAFDPAQLAIEIERMRHLGGRSRPTWVMETQPGCVNWKGDVNAMMQPGELTAAAWHMVAHGAEAVLYWQWRSAPGGQEQYHGTIIGQDGRPRPHYDEIARIGAGFARHAALIDGSAPAHDIAVLDRWEDRIALGGQRHHHHYDPARHVRTWYAAVQRLGLGADLRDQATGALPRLVIAPQAHLADPTTMDALRDHVRRGGHLLIGPRTAVKDPENALLPSRSPGPLAELLGAEAEDLYALRGVVGIAGLAAAADDLGSGTAQIIGERLAAGPDAVVWACFGNEDGWLAGRPAVVHRSHPGGGSITWCACWPDAAFQTRLIQRLAILAGIALPPAVPPQVTRTRRRGPAGVFTLVINHGAAPVEVDLGHPGIDAISGVAGPILSLPGHGIALVPDARDGA